MIIGNDKDAILEVHFFIKKEEFNIALLTEKSIVKVRQKNIGNKRKMME